MRIGVGLGVPMGDGGLEYVDAPAIAKGAQHVIGQYIKRTMGVVAPHRAHDILASGGEFIRCHAGG